MTRANERDVRKWMIRLAHMVASGAMTDDALEARIAMYADGLASEFDAAAFCDASSFAVARNSKFFPTYSETSDALRAWWREQPTSVCGSKALPPAKPVCQRDISAREQRDIERAVEWGNPKNVANSLAIVEAHTVPMMRVAAGNALASAVWKYARHNLPLIPAALWGKELLEKVAKEPSGATTG